MISVATSSIVSISNNSSFWSFLRHVPTIPAAGYVLIGVVISGIFSTLSDKRNIANNRNLKELENKNSRELKELENEHKEKLQEMKEKGDKYLRLLDNKIKIFSDFNHSYSDMIISADSVAIRKDRIETLRKEVYKVRLVVPLLKDELSKLDIELVAYSNFCFKVSNLEITLTKEEIDTKVSEFTGKIFPLTSIILDTLAENL